MDVLPVAVANTLTVALGCEQVNTLEAAVERMGVDTLETTFTNAMVVQPFDCVTVTEYVPGVPVVKLEVV